MSRLDEIIYQTLGEESALFMSNPKPGTKQVMPETELNVLVEKAKQAIKDLMLKIANQNIAERRSYERVVKEIEKL